MLSADSTTDVVQVLQPSGSLALTYGRIEKPIEGWLALHSGQVKTTPFCVSLLCSVSQEGDLSVSCCSIAGEELALIDFKHSGLQGQTIGDLRRVVAKELKRDSTCLRLVTLDGTLLDPNDDWKPLAVALMGTMPNDPIPGASPCTVC